MKYELQIVFTHTKPKLEPVFYSDMSFTEYQKIVEGYRRLYDLELDDANHDELDRTMYVKCYAMPKTEKKRRRL